MKCSVLDVAAGENLNGLKERASRETFACPIVLVFVMNRMKLCTFDDRSAIKKKNAVHFVLQVLAFNHCITMK